MSPYDPGTSVRPGCPELLSTSRIDNTAAISPSRKSQPFSQSYRSSLPTSLTYIVLIDQRLLTLET